jgi:hypothetical protein
LERSKRTEDERKLVQKNFMDEFEQAKEDLKEEIQDNEGVDIQEQMLKERRDWIQEYKALHANKPPEDLKDFYERFNTETPLSPEDEELKKLQEDEESKSKKKKKKEEKKDKGKKKKKKGDDGDDEKKQVLKIGPSEVVQKFDEFYEDYNEVWANRDESENY